MSDTAKNIDSDKFIGKHELNEIDLMQYERMQRELIYELNSKRSHIEKVEKELKEAQFKVVELEQALAVERQKFSNFENDWKTARNVASELEKDRVKAIENFSQMKINNEVLNNENATLKEKVKKLQFDNENQKKIILDLETQIRCHKGFQNDTIMKVNQTDSLLTLAESTSEKLLSEHQNLKEYVEEYIELKSQFEVGLNFLVKSHDKAYQDLRELKIKYISLLAELHMTRNETHDISSNRGENEDFDSLIKRISQLTSELEQERNVNLSLLCTLESMTKEFSAAGLKTIFSNSTKAIQNE